MATNIIDTNVLAVANKCHQSISEQCIFACEIFLEGIIESEALVSIDNEELIFSEYLSYANLKGNPGLGDAFIKWLNDNRGYPGKCEMVSITPTHGLPIQYSQIPTTGEFDGFDLSDQKFLAVAFGSQFAATIHNAVDSDWALIEQALASHGITLSQLCLSN